MKNGMKRIFATFAASTLLAASALVAAPASAQTGGGPGDPYGCYDIASYNQCCHYTYTYDHTGNYIYQCCYYYYYAGGPPECYSVYYQPSEDPAHRPSQEPTEPAGQ